METKRTMKRLLAFVLSMLLAWPAVPSTNVSAEPAVQMDGTSEETAFEIGNAEDPEAAWDQLAEAITDEGCKRSDVEAEDEEHPTYLRLTSDFTYTSGKTRLVVNKDRFIVLDLAGHSIDMVNRGCVFEVNGNLVLNDSQGGGELKRGHSTDGGGARVNGGGTFTMNGGCITSSTSGWASERDGHGGGVSVKGDGTFIMNGGSIYQCGAYGTNAWMGCSGVFVEGRFIMNGGSVSHNSCSCFKGSGAVWISGGSFLMTGGSICDNENSYSGYEACYGAGVTLQGTFTMTGGSITRNVGTKHNCQGAGVCVREGSFTMTGGSISENGTRGYKSAGVYVCGNSGKDAFYLGGSAEIFDNGNQNVGIDNGAAPLKITEKLTNSIPIKIGNRNDRIVAKGCEDSGYVVTYDDMTRLRSSDENYYLGMDDEQNIKCSNDTAIITFEAGEGQGSMEPQIIPKNLKVSLKEIEFTPKGDSRFIGWNTKPDWSGVTYNDKGIIKLEEDITLYARWSSDPLVTFIHNGGKGESYTQIIKKNTETALMANTFTKEHYRLKEWNTKADGRGEGFQDQAEVKISDNMTLYAQWERSEYVINFDSNGGEGEMDPQCIGVGSADTVSANSFTKEHYRFVGWNTKADGSGESFSDEQTISLSKDIKLYAQWERSEYVISFQANGGQGVMDRQIAARDTQVKLKANTFTREGFVFDKWEAFKGDNKFAEYSDEQSISADTDITLKAVWRHVYTVTFHANDGTEAVATQTFLDGIKFSVSENGFAREGYVFDGWNEKADGTGRSYSDQAEVTFNNNVDLYVKWAKQIRVTFNANGGIGTMEPQIMIDGHPEKLKKNAFSREGYAFSEWNTTANATGSDYSDEQNVSVSENTTLYAQWVKLIRVQYNANGGQGTMEDQIVKENQSLIIRNHTFTRKGYRFTGWNTSSDGTGTAYAELQNVILGDGVTLYAQWIKEIKITFDANGGSGSMEQQSCLENQSIVLQGNDYTRVGYLFLGWNTKADGTGTAYRDTQVNIKFSQDTTLYAQWEKLVCVAFDANGGFGCMDAVYFRKSQNVQIPGIAFGREGYAFLGWNTKKDGTGTSYNNYQSTTFDQDVTLYAQWEKLVKLTVYDYTGTEVVDVYWHRAKERFSLDYDTSYRKGYQFAGWNTKADGSGSIYVVNQRLAFEQDMILYEQWDKLITVLLDSNNSNDELKRFRSVAGTWYSVDLNETSERFCEYGSQICGWNTEPDGSGTAYDANRIFVADQDITLYAQYTKHVSIIFVNVNEDGDSAVFDYAEGADIQLPAARTFGGFLPDNAVFVEWNTQPDGSGRSFKDEAKIEAEELTLYPVWTDDTVILTYDSNVSGNSPYTQRVPRGIQTSLKLCRFEASGAQEEKVCIGWNTRRDGLGSDYKLKDVITISQDTTLYAQWGKPEYSLKMEGWTYGEKPNAPVFTANHVIGGSEGEGEVRPAEKEIVAQRLGEGADVGEASHVREAAWHVGERPDEKDKVKEDDGESWSSRYEFSYRFKLYGADDDRSSERTPVNAGRYTVYVLRKDAKSRMSTKVVASADFIIKPQTVSMEGLVSPEAKSDLYESGKEQQLVKPGSVQGGTMLYAITGAGDPEPDFWDYTDKIPCAKDKGTYTVWYKGAKGYGPYNITSSASSLKVSIGEALPDLKEKETENKSENRTENKTEDPGSDDQKENPQIETEPIKKGDVITDPKTGAEVEILSVSDKDITAAYVGPADMNAKIITIPDTVTSPEGQSVKVTVIKANALKKCKAKTIVIGKNVTKLPKKMFNGLQVKTIIIKTTKLTQKSVKNSLKGIPSKKITIKVQVGTKKQNKIYVKKYRKIFTKKNAGMKATVK